MSFPKRIICLTEESVEFIYLLGQEHRIVGVSAYAKRPTDVLTKPKVSAFINGNIKKIVELKPDLVIGFSDIQKDLARDLIASGMNVWIANHRSIEGILDYLSMLGRVLGCENQSEKIILELRTNIEKAKTFASSLRVKPKVYIEEWDDPMISGIEWFCELVELCGGEVALPGKRGALASDRIVTPEEVIKSNPDIILASWCGKKVDIKRIKERSGFRSLNAIQNDSVFELIPEIFLQPGPAPLKDGIGILIDLFSKWKNSNLDTHL